MDHKNSMAYHQSIKFIQYKTGKQNGEKKAERKRISIECRRESHMDKTLHDAVGSGNSVSRNSGISCYSGYIQLTYCLL